MHTKDVPVLFAMTKLPGELESLLGQTLVQTRIGLTEVLFARFIEVIGEPNERILQLRNIARSGSAESANDRIDLLLHLQSARGIPVDFPLSNSFVNDRLRKHVKG
jgi:hypothetical protein